MANSPTRRAGVYRQVPQGYRAFFPSALPPSPPIALDEELLETLSHADRALGRLDGVGSAVPDEDVFVYMYLRREAVLSSQIEGTQSSLVDLLEYESGNRSPSTPLDVGEVANYVAAMRQGLRALKKIPISLRLVREIHARLMKGVRGGNKQPGDFRTQQNWIGSGQASIESATFVPPPPSELPNLLSNLENFVHDRRPMPVLVKAAILHAQFETIHPFLDGNGRVGRLLITFFLCERDVLRQPLLCLSHYLKLNRQSYYERLQAIRDAGDWESWIRFFLQGIIDVSGDAVSTARKLLKMQASHRAAIESRLGRQSGLGLKLMESLYHHPFVTVEHVAKTLRVAPATAGRVVDRLEAIGILRETTGRKRNRWYCYQPYLDLFRDDNPPG